MVAKRRSMAYSRSLCPWGCPTTSSLLAEENPVPSDARMPPVRTENESPSQPAKGNKSGIYYGLDSLLRRDHP
jgi:hypothetical protein